MQQYKCVEKLVVPELWDYEGEPTGNDFVVEVGEVWFQEEDLKNHFMKMELHKEK